MRRCVFLLLRHTSSLVSNDMQKYALFFGRLLKHDTEFSKKQKLLRGCVDYKTHVDYTETVESLESVKNT